jgi:hypothetical protein
LKKNDRFEVILQPFVKELTDEYIVECTCTKCGKKVHFTPRKQAELASGGIGYKCKNCDTYIATFPCPSYQKTLTVDDEEWQKLSEPAGLNCPSCKANLYRQKKVWGPNLVTSGIMMPTLKSWSDTEGEKRYIAKLKRIIDKDQKNNVTIRHHSVGVRMMSAKESLLFLTTNDWYSISVISNTSSHVNDAKIYKTPFDHDFHNHLFGLINNLRSALDIFTQEIAGILSPGTPESKIDFGMIKEIVKEPTNEMIQLVNVYQKSESYDYLNKLRNVLQHRRIPLLVTVGSYDTSELDTIRPKYVRAKASIKLPNNPSKPDSFENNNSYGVMLFPKINELYARAEIFMLGIYNNIDLSPFITPGLTGALQ